MIPQRNHSRDRCTAYKTKIMNKDKNLKKMFAEMGLSEDQSIKEFNKKLDFTFDFTNNQIENTISTTNHTKTI